MKFNKNSRLVRIDTLAISYYSDAEAYGQIYIPEEIYENNKSIFDNLGMSVRGLDGKYSEDGCRITIEKGSLKHFINTYRFAEEGNHKNIDKDLNECVQKALDIWPAQADKLTELTNNVINMSRIVEKTITLTDDYVIENTTIPKGVKLAYSVYPTVPDSDAIFEIDFSTFDK